MTFLFDPAKAMEVLTGMEAGWGGTPQQRMAGKFRFYESKYGTSAPKPADEAALEEEQARRSGVGAPAQPVQTGAAQPAPEPAASESAAPASGLAPVPAPTPSTPR
jgi:penicillin-binding protein 2